MNIGYMKNRLFILAVVCLAAFSCKDDRPLHPTPSKTDRAESSMNGITYQINVYSFADSDNDIVAARLRGVGAVLFDDLQRGS